MAEDLSVLTDAELVRRLNDAQVRLARAEDMLGEVEDMLNDAADDGWGRVHTGGWSSAHRAVIYWDNMIEKLAKAFSARCEAAGLTFEEGIKLLGAVHDATEVPAQPEATVSSPQERVQCQANG